jgi:hypothetical protein
MNLKRPQVVVKGENNVYKVDVIDFAKESVLFYKNVKGALEFVEYDFDKVDLIK